MDCYNVMETRNGESYTAIPVVADSADRVLAEIDKINALNLPNLGTLSLGEINDNPLAVIFAYVVEDLAALAAEVSGGRDQDDSEDY